MRSRRQIQGHGRRQWPHADAKPKANLKAWPQAMAPRRCKAKGKCKGVAGGDGPTQMCSQRQSKSKRSCKDKAKATSKAWSITVVKGMASRRWEAGNVKGMAPRRCEAGGAIKGMAPYKCETFSFLGAPGKCEAQGASNGRAEGQATSWHTPGATDHWVGS